jgi:hypothetical protein
MLRVKFNNLTLPFAFQVSGSLPFGIRPRSRIKYTLLGLTARAPARILEIRRVYARRECFPLHYDL